MRSDFQGDSGDDIQLALDEHARLIEKKLAGSGAMAPKIVLSHLLMLAPQKKQKGQFFRRSSVTTCSGICEHLSTAAIRNRRQDELHKKVHSQFISYLDRDNTFLDYVVRKIGRASSYAEPRLLVFNFGTEQSSSLPGPELPDTGVFSIDHGLAESVCPQRSAERFIKELYSLPGKSAHSTDWNEFFFLKRVQASVCSPIPRGSPEDVCDERKDLSAENLAIRAWRCNVAELAGIQSAISYMGTLSTYQEKTRAFSIVVSIQAIHATPERGTTYAVAMIAFGGTVDAGWLGGNLHKIEKVIGKCNAILPKEVSASDADRNTSLTLELSCSYGDLVFDPQENGHRQPLEGLKELIRNTYGSDPFIDNIRTHSIRCLMLLQKIFGETHEQQKLDFYFVCGERSVFADKTILRRFNADERRLFDEMRIKGGPDDVRRQLLRAAEFIAREHYPWFEDGRHALFWDCSSSDERPLGLVKLKVGNWKQIVHTRNYQSSSVRSPECLLLYSIGVEDAAGMLHLKPDSEEHAGRISSDLSRGQTTIRAMVVWNRGRWTFPSNSAEVKMQEYLYGRFPENRNEIWIRQLSEIVALISSNGQKGGTIVVTNGDSGKAPFKEMGKTLDVQPIGCGTEDLVDRLKLISHDGASVVSISTAALSNWQHRRYLFPGGEEVQALETLFDLLQNKSKNDGAGISLPRADDRISQTNHPLRWKGARRWAAAIAAFNRNVKLSIVISQDGDIQIWNVSAPEAESMSRTIYVYEITRTGEIRSYHYPYGRITQREKNQALSQLR